MVMMERQVQFRDQEENSMPSIPTPHIGCKERELVAKTVLMPGDPLRARMVAETFLENTVQFNAVRGMAGFTGMYKGRKISVMGSGMGMPSIGIYSYELFQFYGVDNIIRIGSSGAYKKELNLYETVLVEDAYSESTYAKIQGGYDKDVIPASTELTDRLQSIAQALAIPVVRGRVHSSDVFYQQHFDAYKKVRDEHGCICVDMESFALFHNARVTGKSAACLLTISDNLETEAKTTSEERQTAFTDMMKIALEMAE